MSTMSTMSIQCRRLKPTFSPNLKTSVYAYFAEGTEPACLNAYSTKGVRLARKMQVGNAFLWEYSDKRM
jgi:hypothetical protein